MSPEFERLPDLATSSLEAGREPRPGDSVGSYRIVSLIGRGGMGSVYLAERADGEIHREVAIKFLRADGHGAEWRTRFLKERQLLASLNHPSVVQVIDAGHTGDGRPYLVMEHVEGVPIDRYAAGIGVRDRLKLFLKVCEGVSHAHRHLIIHRDLKPSNILVDGAEQPKLLDFGIARLLSDTGELTQTMEQLLTPNYASPEQLRGEAQTTATDVYSLGAVLYKLLTGVSPRESLRGGGKDEPPAPSRVNTEAPRDLDFVVRKALRAEADHRYQSVEEFAWDVRAVLEWRPVGARGGDVWYRSRRSLRRHWMPASAAALAMASLTTGMWVANRERRIAERRFGEVRQLAAKLFDIEFEMRKLPGSTKASQLVVDTSLAYLKRLAAEVHGDPGLSLEVGSAYFRLARVQGVPISHNLGQMTQAEESLQASESFIQSVLASQPGNRTALLRSAQIAHDRMLLARYNGRYDLALSHARETEKRLEKLHAGAEDRADAAPILSTYLNVADQYARREQFEDALRLCRHGLEIAGSTGRKDYVPDFLWIVADVHRRTGDLEQALNELNESVRLSEPSTGNIEVWRTMNFALSLICRGDLLGEENALSLGRSGEAVASLEKAFHLADELAHRDPVDQSSRSRIANAGISMGGILRASDPARALAVYDHTLRHAAEIPDNPSFRRFEVSALAGSSYALRKLGRAAEAKRRLDAAFDRLRTLGLHPAQKVALGSEEEDSLRALADYHAGTGDPSQAAGIYRDLLGRVQAAQPRPESSLNDAVRLSTIYRAASAAERAAGSGERAAALEARDRDLWQHWRRALPDNAFVRRRLETAAVERTAGRAS